MWKNVIMSSQESTRLKNLYHSLNNLLSNNTYNVSVSDLHSMLDHLKMEEAENETDFSSHETKCGGALTHLVTAYTVYHPYFAIAVCVFGTFANVLNVIVLTRKDMACAPINRILTALAVADVLLMVEYIPFAYYYYFVLLQKMDFPYLGAVFILFHTHVTQTLHTISICLTLTLAIWRYLAIGYPEKNHIFCSDRRCTIAIVLSYILPILLCAPTYATLTITSKEILEDKVYILYHTDLNEIFKRDQALLQLNFWVYAVFIKILPCCILTVISCWLIRTLFMAKRRKQVLRSYDNYLLNADSDCRDVKRKATKAERRADRTTKMLVAVLLLFLITEFPQGIFAFLIGLKGKDLFLECYQKYGVIMDILALTNGSINFILYCCMNRMFRATFGQLFRHKILSKWTPPPPPPSEVVHTTTIIANGTNTTEL